MTRSELAAKILALHHRGEALNIHAVKKHHPELLEAAYSFTPYLGWKQALELAGLEYHSIRIELEPYVECRICKDHSRNLTTHLSLHGVSPSEYRKEFPGAEILSEEYIASRTRRAASTVPHWEPLPSIEYVKDRAWFWHLRNGRANTRFIQHNDASMLGAARSRGLSWQDVLLSIGLDPRVEFFASPNIYKTKEEILAGLRRRAQKNLPLSSTAVQKEERSLCTAVFRHIGSWKVALEEAGLTDWYQRSQKQIRHKRKKRFPDQQSIIDALKQHVRAGHRLTFDAIQANDPGLNTMMYKHFKTLAEAVEAAGLGDLYRQNKRRAQRRSHKS